jgi:hypothetical protein
MMRARSAVSALGKAATAATALIKAAWRTSGGHAKAVGQSREFRALQASTHEAAQTAVAAARAASAAAGKRGAAGWKRAVTTGKRAIARAERSFERAGRRLRATARKK